ncbi:outer membrane lipoprotein chaperone LolA [Xylophilus sp. ASV27]|uniref:outer membrane lipoprotein chaperone LolA n=1 Tax=Xylophilus sp. ASV27 TaxID=2795129 RepID=UPI0018ECD36E|nr:outer membrane lipoprotein chaperone LolA [Xylophilus sp. ASV27]
MTLPIARRALLSRSLFAIVFVAIGLGSAWADGLSSLEGFMRSAQSGRADFTQTVTAPSRAGEAARSKTSEGTFEFQRPNRFRFVYTKPFAQTLVADGKTLWMYDMDLNQVTARQQSQVLGSTPAALLASAPNLQALEKDFTLQPEPDQDGLQWVSATPKSRDGQLQRVRVGFKNDQLAALDILDSFGQRSVLSFRNLQSNPALPASTFDFKPPAGADVIRQ